MSLEISIKVENLEEIEEQFTERIKRLDDISEIEPLFRQVMNYDLRKRFESSPPTASGGLVYGQEYWKQLSDSYLLARPDRARGTIYKDTQKLMESLTIPQHPEQISEVTVEGQYTYGSNLPYAQKLQDILKRPIVFLHELLNLQLANIVSLYILSDKEIQELEIELTDIVIEGLSLASDKTNESLERLLENETKSKTR